MLAAFAIATAHAADPGPGIPSSIQAEHKELHADLAKAMRAGGRTGAAAKEVEKLLAPHFTKEEEYALPPLAVLSQLAAGKRPADSAGIIRMTDRLKAEMPQMLREHKEISAAAARLRKAAQEERKAEAAEFADGLLAHAMQEEQVLYPSAILVGEFLKR
jgi:iron-sulfur cluster repair protein YtfE (RIC family)